MSSYCYLEFAGSLGATGLRIGHRDSINSVIFCLWKFIGFKCAVSRFGLLLDYWVRFKEFHRGNQFQFCLPGLCFFAYLRMKFLHSVVQMIEILARVDCLNWTCLNFVCLLSKFQTFAWRYFAELLGLLETFRECLLYLLCWTPLT